MAIKSSSQGSISFSEIKKEFGDSNGSTAGVSLGKYRVSETYGVLTRPLDDGIPTSGTISMSQFYGKKLNIVVNYYSGGTEHRPNTGSQRYKQSTKNNQKAECVGEFKEPPKTSQGNPKTNGSKVWLHINKTIGSQGALQQQSYCAFRTGNWQNGTDLRVYAGEEAAIRGRGGDGGEGGDGGSENGENGEVGTSAIGIQYSDGTTILTSHSQAVAAGGGGGGAGGGSARQEDPGQDRKAGGGGGGGGAGLPPGTGGAGGKGGGRYSSGGKGDGGSTNAHGDGGNGGDNASEARGGHGGQGGDPGVDGQNGGDGSGNKGNQGEGGNGGAGGNWIRTGGNQVQTGGWKGAKQGDASSGGVN